MSKVEAFYLQTEVSTEKHTIQEPLLVPSLDSLHSSSKCALEHPKLASLSLFLSLSLSLSLSRSLTNEYTRLVFLTMYKGDKGGGNEG